MPVNESSRDRLLKAGKHLFANRGYENTSTIMIAREAGTSESQLIKHYGSKDGLLSAIFESGWNQMSEQLRDIQHILDPLQKLRALADVIVDSFERDFELKELMLLEARRVRREGREVLISSGFLEFTRVIDAALKQMRDQGQLRSELRPQAVRSVLIGLTEGLLRDDLLARRLGHEPLYTRSELTAFFDMMFLMLVPPTQQAPQTKAKKGATQKLD